MDYYHRAYPHRLNEGDERRRSPRKPLRQRVSIANTGHGIIRGHTLDISASGLSVMIPVALNVTSVCAVRFELFVDGSLIRFAGNGQIAHCSCAGMEGFRVGMKFKVQDPSLLPVLNAFLAR